MYIENEDTLVVKSDALHYEKERSGKKPNTVRIEIELLGEINRDYVQFHDDIKYIRVISSMNQACSFTRKISDISYWNDMVIISWEHSNGTN